MGPGCQKSDIFLPLCGFKFRIEDSGFEVWDLNLYTLHSTLK